MRFLPGKVLLNVIYVILRRRAGLDRPHIIYYSIPRNTYHLSSVPRLHSTRYTLGRYTRRAIDLSADNLWHLFAREIVNRNFKENRGRCKLTETLYGLRYENNERGNKHKKRKKNSLYNQR